MKRRWMIFALAIAVIAGACTSNSSSDNNGTSGGPITLTMWMGYTPPPPVATSQEYLSLQAMIARFEKANPNIKINMQYVNSDNALTKLTVALQGGQQPDITYQYGTNMPQVAQAPKVVDLTQRVQDPGFNWNDFFPGERAVATVNGKVLGVPALVDNLAVVYNKTLFAKAGLSAPSPDWTWTDFANAAKAITDPSQKIFGAVFPADASETMVWEYEAMLWEAGGEILSPDNTKAVFNSAAGVRAATMLESMKQAGSLYLDYHPDSGQSENLFNAGNVGMIITGPWDLSSFPSVKYGVVQMPSFDPGGSHITIAGPDNWVILDNGTARVNAAWDFVKFMTSPQEVLADSLATGHLPTRASVEKLPGFSAFNTKFPGEGTFAANLANVTKARPQVSQYPQVSAFLGQALVSILLGQKSPQDALNQAAQQADSVLSSP